MMTLSWRVATLLLLTLVTGILGTYDDKRQLHQTVAPHTAPDPLEEWMSSTASKKPNVLFLIVDDLRPKLGCYGEDNMVTPNIDYLASKSVRFHQAFAQSALCSPSRTSFLTGRRPETTRVFDLNTYFRKVAGNFTTLPQFFKNHGYVAQGVGKIYHPGEAGGFTDDYPYSWSSLPIPGDTPFSNAQKRRSTFQPVNETRTGKLQDTNIADSAINFLRQRSHQRGHPFFLAVGFHKPHLPWIFPKQYLDLYPHSHIHLAQHRRRPSQLPELGWSPSLEIHAFGDIAALNITDPDLTIPDYYQYKLRQGYSAATSYVDALIGRVMEALDHYGFSDNTIVSLLGDHGWHLGDNGEWCKHTNFEMALRIPMMLYVPGVTSKGYRFNFIDALSPDFDKNDYPHLFGNQHSTTELVEAVDLYPTLIELAGLQVPQTCPENSLHVRTCTEGTSLVPLVKKVRNLRSVENFTWKQAAYSVYHRHWQSKKPVMGYSVRTSTHRYTEWVAYDRQHFRANFSSVLARELYSHADDPYEFHNVAEEASQSGKAQEMARLLRDGWRKTLTDYLGTVH